MKQRGIESIFLTYINNSLIEDPENFYKIFNEIKYHFRSSPYFESVYTRAGPVIKIIIAIAKYRNPQIINIVRKEIEKDYLSESKPEDWVTKRRFEVAAEAVYGYRDGYCEKKCLWRTLRKGILPDHAFNGDKRINCYECMQLYFLGILGYIVRGVEYSDIPGFSSFITNGYKHIATTVKLTHSPKATPFHTTITPRRSFIFPDISGIMTFNKSEIKELFNNEFLKGVVSYSLVEFLLQDEKNRKKIKQCPVCKKFYYGRTNQIYCSGNCKNINNWPPEKRNKYMKEYREKKRIKTLKRKTQLNETEIQRIMNILNITKDEAIDTIKDDENL